MAVDKNFPKRMQTEKTGAAFEYETKLDGRLIKGPADRLVKIFTARGDEVDKQGLHSEAHGYWQRADHYMRILREEAMHARLKAKHAAGRPKLPVPRAREAIAEGLDLLH